MAVAVRRLSESRVPGRAGVDWPGQITAAVGSQHRAHRTCRSKAGTDVQVVWLPDPVQARQIDQQEISTPRHGVDQIGMEPVEREEGRRGARGVVALLGEQASDALQTLQIAGSAASGGGLGLADQDDPSARRLRTLAPGRGR